MRWSCDTAALRDGPLGKAPWAVESRKVVRCDGGRAPTPASFEPPVFSPVPLSVPTLKLCLSLSSSPPQAERDRARIVAAIPTRMRVGDIYQHYVRMGRRAMRRPGYASFRN